MAKLLSLLLIGVAAAVAALSQTLSQTEVHQLASQAEGSTIEARFHALSAKYAESISSSKEQAIKIKRLTADKQKLEAKLLLATGKAAGTEDLGEDVGRRGGAFLSTTGSFTLSSGSNTAGNDEALRLSEANDEADLENSKKKVNFKTMSASAMKKKLHRAGLHVHDSKTSQTPAAPVEIPDAGAPARCKQVNNGTKPGLLDCVPAQATCATPTEKGGGGWIGNNKAAFTKAWGGKVSCPDGISALGVYVTMYPKGICAKWSSAVMTDPSMRCNSHLKDEVLCTKPTVKHVQWMSQSSGVFQMKRLKCTKNKCAVYKTGACIDIGKPVWSHVLNNHIKDMAKEATTFAKEVEKLLVTYNNTLPGKHLCSDTCNTLTPESKLTHMPKNMFKTQKVKHLLDATLGKNSLLIF